MVLNMKLKIGDTVKVIAPLWLENGVAEKNKEYKIIRITPYFNNIYFVLKDVNTAMFEHELQLISRKINTTHLPDWF